MGLRLVVAALLTLALTHVSALEAIQHARPDGLEPELLVIDLDGDGIQLSSFDSGVSFVFAPPSQPVKTSWTAAGSADAFIGIDGNRDGRITSVRELLGGLLGPPNGLAYLEALDGVAVGSIDRRCASTTDSRRQTRQS